MNDTPDDDLIPFDREPADGGRAGHAVAERGGRRRAAPVKSRRRRRLLVSLAVLVVVVVLVVLAVRAVSGYFAGPEDYTGQGSGSVVVEVQSGANGQQIANVLARKDVVASAEAFYRLSLTDSRAQQIQPGFFKVRRKMSSAAALDALVDRGNRVEGKVNVPEGARIDQVVDNVVASTDITRKEITAVLADPSDVGLPAAAKGNAEGYLYPATYTVEPGTDAKQLVTQMVAKTVQVEKDLDIDARAQQLGYTSEQILTVASILEYEAKRDKDYPKVARVLYNRLERDMPLQLDSTVSYVSGRKGDVFTTEEERNAKSAYNTYQQAGLPPGPIGSPGEKTIEAALNPADGPWLYFVAVNLETGETKYATTLAEHEKNAEESREYCRNSDIC